jgi:hypothetical protein
MCGGGRRRPRSVASRPVVDSAPRPGRLGLLRMRMRGLTARYVLRRLGIFVLTIWLASTIIFTVRRLMAGDPVAAMVGRLPIRSGRVENSAAMVEAGRDRFGLDDPVLVQYGKVSQERGHLRLRLPPRFLPRHRQRARCRRVAVDHRSADPGNAHLVRARQPDRRVAGLAADTCARALGPATDVGVHGHPVLHAGDSPALRLLLRSRTLSRRGRIRETHVAAFQLDVHLQRDRPRRAPGDGDRRCVDGFLGARDAGDDW